MALAPADEGVCRQLGQGWAALAGCPLRFSFADDHLLRRPDHGKAKQMSLMEPASPPQRGSKWPCESGLFLLFPVELFLARPRGLGGLNRLLDVFGRRLGDRLAVNYVPRQVATKRSFHPGLGYTFDRWPTAYGSPALPGPPTFEHDNWTLDVRPVGPDA